MAERLSGERVLVYQRLVLRGCVWLFGSQSQYPDVILLINCSSQWRNRAGPHDALQPVSPHVINQQQTGELFTAAYRSPAYHQMTVRVGGGVMYSYITRIWHIV